MQFVSFYCVVEFFCHVDFQGIEVESSGDCGSGQAADYAVASLVGVEILRFGVEVGMVGRGGRSGSENEHIRQRMLQAITGSIYTPI